MFRTFAFWVTLLLIVTVSPVHAAHDHDSDRSPSDYSGNDGQTTLPGPNDFGIDHYLPSDDWEPTYASYTPASIPKAPSPTPPPDFSKIKTPSVHLNFESNSDGDENQSQELQDYRKSFTSILDHKAAN